MPRLLIITHPEVVVEPARPIGDWGLSALGKARAEHFAGSGHLAGVTHLWSSTETKAQETARILGDALGLAVALDARLGENDRTATGFLPPALFETAADAFFAHPGASYRGWETACAAQTRIVRAVKEIAGQHSGGDLAVVTHGAVGTLLYCHLKGLPIDRAWDQPGQGHFWTADLPSLRPGGGWVPIA